MISVIVPIYNVEKYLAKCIESICNQSYSDLQILLIDDGSVDGSGKIAARYAQNDERITLISQNNRGLSAARNVGLKHAIGEYITFVDADDFIDEDYLSVLYSSIQDYDVLQCGYRRVKESGEVIETDSPLCRYKLVSACLKLIKREFLLRHNIRFVDGQKYEDVLFSLDIWVLCPRIKVIPYCGYNYLLNPVSITSVRHDTGALFKLLFERFKTAGYYGKLIVFYTYFRLRLHFLLNRS